MIFRPELAPTVILIRRPMLWVISFVAINCVVLLLLWLAFDYGQSMAGFSSSEAGAYIEELEEKLEESQREIIESSRQATMLERNSQIVDGASGELRDNLKQTQNEIQTLKKELSFYKSIVAPEQGRRSLTIQTMQVSANPDGNYRYKLMLTQRGQNDLFARGTIDVKIDGTKQGELLTLLLSDVSNDTKKPMKFGLKYFQNFTGVMNLPEGFQPDTIRVKVEPKSSKLKTINEQYVWSTLTARGI